MPRAWCSKTIAPSWITIQPSTFVCSIAAARVRSRPVWSKRRSARSRGRRGSTVAASPRDTRADGSSSRVCACIQRMWRASHMVRGVTRARASSGAASAFFIPGPRSRLRLEKLAAPAEADVEAQCRRRWTAGAPDSWLPPCKGSGLPTEPAAEEGRRARHAGGPRAPISPQARSARSLRPTPGSIRTARPVAPALRPARASRSCTTERECANRTPERRARNGKLACRSA